MGPIGAIGIAVAMLSMLTFLPAMLAIFGRRAFWRPRMFGWDNGIPHVGDEGADDHPHHEDQRSEDVAGQSPSDNVAQSERDDV